MVVIKSILFLITVICYFINTAPLYPFLFVFPHQTRMLLNYILSLYTNFTLFFLNIKIYANDSVEKIGRGKLIVANHLSYLDILIFASMFRSSFVTSVEIKNTPFLGQLCQLAGCLFVERRSRKNLLSEISEITNSLLAGNNVVVFPEATSTNGEQVLRFKRPLFRAAREANTSVIPITINYHSLENEVVSKENRDLVFWYGDMTFLDHLLKFFKVKETRVNLIKGQELSFEENDDESTIAQKSFELVRSKYRPVVS